MLLLSNSESASGKFSSGFSLLNLWDKSKSGSDSVCVLTLHGFEMH